MWRTVLLLALFAAGPASSQRPDAEASAPPPSLPQVETLPPDVPEYYLSRLEVGGEVVGDRAELNVRIVLYVTRPEVWQSVPLRMPAATILSRDYRGEGEAVPLLSEGGAEGLVWAFRGAGRHELDLGIHVPVVRTATGRRLDLTLPRLPEQFRGRLDLTIPGAPIEVASDGFEVRPVSVLNERTRVEAFIPGGGSPAAGTRVQLSWSRPGGEAPGSVGSVRTEASLRPEVAAAEWVMTARQTVRAAAGGLSVVRARPPEGFEFAGVDGDRVAEVLALEEASGDGRWVTARLDNSPAPTAELTWRFVAPLKAPSTVAVGGVEVDTARQHSGTLRVHAAPGVRVAVDWPQADSVRRVAGVGGDVAAAVEFRQPGFRLPVVVRDDPAVTTVRPLLSIRAGGSRVEMRHEFRVGVRRGRLAALEIEWPDAAAAAAARFAPIEQPGYETALYATEGDRTRVSFVEPQTGDFRFGFLRSVRPDGGGDTRVPVPRLDATLELPTETLVHAEDGWDVEVSAAGEATFIEAEDLAVDPDATPPGTRLTRRADLFGLPSTVEVTQVPRETETSVSTTLVTTPEYNGAFRGLSVQTTQLLDYRVAFGSVSEVLLEVPGGGEGGSDRLFRLDGKPLPPEALSPVQDSIVRVALPTPASSFQLEVTFLPVSLGEEEPAEGGGVAAAYRGDLPLVRPVGAGFEAVRVRLRRAGAFRLEPLPVGEAEEAAAAWIPVPTAEADSHSWILSVPERIEAVAVSVAPSSASNPSSLADAVADVRVVRGPRVVRVAAEYRFDRPPSEVRVRLPEGGQSGVFTWNDDSAPSATRIVAEGDLLVAPPPQPRAGDRLLVSFDLPAEGAAVLERLAVPLPSISYRVREVRLELDPGEGRTLLVPPASVTPTYRWRWNGRFYSRDRGGRDGLTFAGMSVPDRIGFVSADLRAVFVFGTLIGLALAAGGGLLPADLFAPAGVVLAVAVAAGSIWFAEAYRVLAQPVLVGFLLGAAAVASGRRRRRRGRATGGPKFPHAVDSGWTVTASASDAEATVIRGRSSVQP